MYLLDTNVLIAVLNDKPRIVADTVAANAMAGNHIATSVIVIFELLYGVAKSRHTSSNALRLDEVLAGPIEVLMFDAQDAEVAGQLRASLETAGTPIGPYDVLIAGQSLRHGATLVTANTREFARVPGLNVEDWAK